MFKKNKPRVLFLTTELTMPGSRFRVYEYITSLREAGVYCNIRPSFPGRYKAYPSFVKSIFLRRFFSIFYRLLRIIFRLIDCLISLRYDIVFLQRDLLPGYYYLPEIVLFWLKRKIIFDFDDSIFLTSSKQIKDNAKQYRKIASIISMSKAVIAGNSYLANFSKSYNSNVFIIPTPINTKRYVVRNNVGFGNITIGWSGTTANLPYIKLLEPVFEKLYNKYNNLIFKIICEKPEEVNCRKIRIVTERWTEVSEVAGLQSLDIGLMPLPDNNWTKGKCGLKALQYMAVGVPVVVSPVGVNREIIRDGENGFLADSEGEWLEKLSLLIENKELREKLGEAGRKTVEKKYSIKANLPKLLTVFKSVIDEKKVQ